MAITERAKKVAEDLNIYDALSHSLSGEEDGIWQDVITRLPDYDAAATEEADPTGRSDVVVLTDGSRIGWFEPERAWRPFAAGS